MDSNEVHISKFIETNPNILSDEGKIILWTIKSHMDFNHELKSTLPPEELHPQGSRLNKFMGYNTLINRFVHVYKSNRKIKDDLSVWLLRGGIENMTGYHNFTLTLKEYYYSLSCICTSRKYCVLVSVYSLVTELWSV